MRFKQLIFVVIIAAGTKLVGQNNGYSSTFTGAGNGCVAGGTCYYIDSVGGNDSNAGTSKAKAWAHAPGMSCATGTAAAHSYSSTDEVIFKGGDTWSANCFPWTISNGGTTTPNSYAYPGLYLGYDPAWNKGTVNSIRVIDPGSCASGTTLSVSIAGGGGSGATAIANVETDPYAAGDLEFVTLTSNGTGYTSNPTVTFTVTAGSCTALPMAYADIYSPMMNGSGTVYGSSSSISPMLTLNAQYSTLDHIEFAHYLWYAGSSYSGGSPNVILAYSKNQTFQNLYLHDFGMSGAASSTVMVGARNAAQTAGIYGFGMGSGQGGRLINSIFNNYEREVAGGCANGYGGSCTQNTAIYNVAWVTNNVISSWRGGIYTEADASIGYLVAGNKIWAILNDPNTQHPDAVYLQGGTVAYNNILRDIYSGAAAFYIETGNGSTPNSVGNITYLFNNVMFGIGTNGAGTSTPPIGWSSEFISSSASGFSPAPDLRAYNNTFYSNNGNSSCMNAGQWYGKSPTLSTGMPFVLQNNLCVSSQSAAHWFFSNDPSDCTATYGCGLWNGSSNPNSSATQVLVDAANVILSPNAATTYGYTAATSYGPSASTPASSPAIVFASSGNSINLSNLCSESVGGVSLSALCYDINGTSRGSSFQAGAYQSSASAPPNPDGLSATPNP